MTAHELFKLIAWCAFGGAGLLIVLAIAFWESK
jgi:hypothetical protein